MLSLTVAAIVAGAAALVMLSTWGTCGRRAWPAHARARWTRRWAKRRCRPPCLCCCLCAPGCAGGTMAAGLAGLVKGPTADTMPALAACGRGRAVPGLSDPAGLVRARTACCLMAGPAALLLCFNTLGKRLDAVTRARQLPACQRRGGPRRGLPPARTRACCAPSPAGWTSRHPSVLVSRPTRLLRGFVAGQRRAPHFR